MAETETSSESITTYDGASADATSKSSDPNVVQSKPVAAGSPISHEPAPEAAWEGATHFVRYSHVSETLPDSVAVPLFDTHFGESNFVNSLNGDGSVQVKLIEANVGENWNRSLIELEPPDSDSEGEKYSINSVYLFPVQGVSNIPFYSPEDAEIAIENTTRENEVPVPNKETQDKKVAIKNKKIKKIKDVKPDSPYTEGSHYNIVLDAGTNSKEEYELMLPDLKNLAICRLLKFYGKKNIGAETILELINNPFGIVQSSKPYFPTRPGQNIKVKISISAKYFNIFENETFDDFVVDNIHNDFLAVSFGAAEIKDIIEQIVNILEKYDSKVSIFTGSVEGINLKSLSIKMKSFLSEFDKFLRLNKVEVSTFGGIPNRTYCSTSVSTPDQTKFELGFDKSTYRLKYVLHFNPYGNFCNVGIESLADKMDSKVGKVLANYRDMISQASSGIGWMDFLLNNFSGDVKVSFTSVSEALNSAKEPFSKLEANLDNFKSDFDELKFMTADEAQTLAITLNDAQFRKVASELLVRSSDFIGDQFLVDLPNILENVEDLSSLYGLVFDKVSVKDLLDMVLDCATKDLNLPDINEIKLRGALQALDKRLVLDIFFDKLELPDLIGVVSSVCNGNTFGIQDYLDFKKNMPTVPMLDCYMVYYKSDGTVGGLLADNYEGDIQSVLEENNLGDCESLITAIATEKFDIGIIFQQNALNDAMCDILTNGIDKTSEHLENPCEEIFSTLQNLELDSLSPVIINSFGVPEFRTIPFSEIKFDIMNFFKCIDVSTVMPSIDLYLKDMFKASADAMSLTLSGTPPEIDIPSPAELFQKFAQIPELSIELDKINLTKANLTGKLPGLDMDFEMKKIDANFNLPSIKKCNPSFDFGKFQFSGMQDIFSGAIGGIEDALIKGIESGLIIVFKSMLESVLKCTSSGSPDIDSPNYGGLNMNDLLDATDGFSSDLFASVISVTINSAIGRFDPNFFTDLCVPAEDVSSANVEAEDVKKIMDDMSSALKPLEAIRIMQGRINDRDLANMIAAIEDPVIKQVMTPDTLRDIMGVATDYIDFKMLEELQNAYHKPEVLVSICNDRGIPYGIRDIRQNLKDKYNDLTEEEISELIEEIVDETKDSLVDAIAAGAKGALGGDYSDNLPFDENPCSFMPKPSDIPALDFANDLVFDSIFDPIELEYKAEATAFPDVLMVPQEDTSYVKLMYTQYDYILDSEEPYVQDPVTGEYSLNLVQVGENRYNQDFGNHVKGAQTPFYYLETTNNTYVQIDEEFEDIVEKNGREEWKNISDYDNVYVKSSDQKMVPLPGLKSFYQYPAAILDYDYDNDEYVIRFKINKRGTQSNVYAPPIIDAGAEEQPNVEVRYSKESISVKTDSFELDNPDCKVDEVVDSQSAALTQYTFPYKIGYAYGRATDPIFETVEKMHPSIYAYITHITQPTGFHTTEYDTEVYENSVGTAQELSSATFRKSGTHSIMHAFIDVLFDKIADSQLFDTSYLQTFIFESEQINLFKLRDAKSEAKDDYNEQCSFKEDGKNKLKSSSTKKLIYLTFRLYLIEIVARSCFIFDSLYSKDMNAFLCSMMHRHIERDMSAYTNSYYTLFKEKYEEEYGSAYPSTSEIPENDTFYQTISEIYSDISENFSELFPNSSTSGGFIQAFLEEVPIYDDVYAKFPFYCAQAFLENKPFVIQKIKRRDYSSAPDQSSERYGIKNKKEFIDGQTMFVHDGGDSAHSANDGATDEYVLRLCYIKRTDGDYENRRIYTDTAETVIENSSLVEGKYLESGITNYKTISYSKTCNIEQMEEINLSVSEATSVGYQIAGANSDIVSEGKQIYSVRTQQLRQSPTLLNSVKFRFSNSTGGTDSVEPIFLVIPLAETIIPTAEDGSRDTGGLTDIEFIISDTSENSIQYTLKNVIQMENLYNTLISANNAKILSNKPQVDKAFENTKMAIKRAVEALSKEDDDFQFHEKETQNTQLEQSQGVGTEPDFSGKAAKMALMTIPMIIKGAAEMFDPNIKVSKFIRLGADLAGFNIPPPVASLMGLPLNLIPFAPGPPITPLGLAYLATSFLEPKERKRLSDLRRGRNTNPTTGEGGTFIEGTIEEQQAAAKALAIEQIRDTVGKHAALKKAYHDFYMKANDLISDFLDKFSDIEDYYDAELVSNVVALPADSSTSSPLIETYGTGHMVFKGYNTESGLQYPGDLDDGDTWRCFTYSSGHGVALLSPYIRYAAEMQLLTYADGSAFDSQIGSDSSTAALTTGTNDFDAAGNPIKDKSLMSYVSNLVRNMFPVGGFTITPGGAGWAGYNADQPRTWKFDSEGSNMYDDDNRRYDGTADPRYKEWADSLAVDHGVPAEELVELYNPAALHSNFFEWHSLFLKYLDNLRTYFNERTTAEDPVYKNFVENSKYQPARQVLVATETLEATLEILVGVLAAQVISILDPDKTSAAYNQFDAVVGSHYDTLRENNLSTGTVIVPQTEEIEVEEYQYVNYDTVIGDTILDILVKASAIQNNPETFKEIYVERSAGHSFGTNWNARQQNKSALAAAIKLLTSPTIRSMISAIEEDSNSLL